MKKKPSSFCILYFKKKIVFLSFLFFYSLYKRIWLNGTIVHTTDGCIVKWLLRNWYKLNKNSILSTVRSFIDDTGALKWMPLMHVFLAETSNCFDSISNEILLQLYMTSSLAFLSEHNSAFYSSYQIFNHCYISYPLLLNRYNQLGYSTTGFYKILIKKSHCLYEWDRVGVIFTKVYERRFFFHRN